LKYGFPVKHCQQQQFFKSEIIPKEKRKSFRNTKEKAKEIRNTKEKSERNSKYKRIAK